MVDTGVDNFVYWFPGPLPLPMVHSERVVYRNYLLEDFHEIISNLSQEGTRKVQKI